MRFLQTPTRRPNPKPSAAFPPTASRVSNQFELLIMCIELHLALEPVRLRESLTLPLSIRSMLQPQWFLSCNSILNCICKAETECHLTTLLGNTNVHLATAATPRKHGWMPLLTVLFLISYGLMTMLIVEQGTTIENQRSLIRDLFRDSAELSALKGKSARDNARNGQTRLPNSQDPAVQPPSSKNPSSQAVPQHRAQTHGNANQHIQAPSRPASDLQDERRSLITI